MAGIDLDTVRTRISALEAGGQCLKSVQDMASAGQAMMTGVRPPAGFVATSRKQATPNRTQGRHRQEITHTISVLLCLPLTKRGDAVQDDIEAWDAALLASLPGWTPGGARTALDFVGYNVVSLEQGFGWFEWTFSARCLLSV